jgi:hypothetical protein
MVVMVMMMMTGSKRRSGRSKHHQQQQGSKNLIHREHPSTAEVSQRRILTHPVPEVQRKWDDSKDRRGSVLQ